MKRYRVLGFAAAGAAAVAVGVLASAGSAQPRSRGGVVGDRLVTVQLRLDLLGLKTDGAAVIDDSALSARASVTGRLVSIGEEFVVLEMDQRHDVWIPRGNVLLMHVDR